MHYEKGAQHIWLPYTQMKNHLAQLEVKSAKGCEIILEDGRTLIDGISSWWSTAHGYNHPHLIDAIQKQAEKLPHMMLAGCANEATYELAHRLCAFTQMQRVFFADSGSVAIEVAMKIAWQYHINLGLKEKTRFISFKNSYHGDTTGAMSLADLDAGMHEKFKPLLLDNFSLTLPQNHNELDQFEDFIIKHKSQLAGIFVEPLVQCAGGMLFHGEDMLHNIYRIAKKHQILFIADECAVGFYRLGEKFAYDKANIQPDILVLGKALTGGTITLAATLVTDNIFNAFLSDSLDSALMHGPTFMGNPLAAAAANASLDLFENTDYRSKVTKIENHLKQQLEKCRGLKAVNDVRVKGAIGVVEMDLSWEEILKLRRAFIEDGVFLRPFANVIYVMPALSITENELQVVTDAIVKHTLAT